MKIKAPAKINVYLKVLGRRDNGYHDLVMLNQKLSICDELDVVVQSGDGSSPIVMTCDDASLPCDSSNLCWRAAEMIREYAKKSDRVTIHLSKRVPMAAGLGGGSSDAAAILRALNDLWDLKLNAAALSEIGVRLGADVPFFCHESAAAIAEGIGERITELPNLPKMWVILVNPNFPVSTKSVYEAVDLQLTGEVEHVDLPKYYKEFKDVINIVHNDLELVTAAKYPVIKEIESLLVNNGSEMSWMSGSGPTVVGLFSEKAVRDEAARQLDGRGWRIIATENISD